MLKISMPPWMTNPPRDEVNLENDPDYTGETTNNGSSNNLKSTDQTLTQTPTTSYDLGQTRLIPEEVQRDVNDMTVALDGLKRRFVDLVQKIYQN